MTDGPALTGAADPPRAVLAAAELRRRGRPVPPALLASAQQAIAPALGLAPSHTLDVRALTPQAWRLLEQWARRRA